MKKKNLYTSNLATIIILLLSVSCGSNYDSRLITAETIMEENPDSAYYILNTEICQSELTTDADNAKFGLLKTQALVKIDSTITDDSLIKASLSYYSNHTNSADYMKSLFYTAWVQYCNADYYKSMLNITEAYDLALNRKDSYWTAKCAELISLIFIAGQNYAEAKYYSGIAALQYKKIGRKLNYVWCLTDLANSYTGLGLNDSAMITISQIPQPMNYSDSVASAVALDIKLTALFNKGCYVDADSVFNQRLQFRDYYPMGSRLFHLKALMLCNGGRVNDALHYLQAGDSLVSDRIDSIVMNRAHIMYEAAQGDYHKVFRITDTLYGIRDRMYNQLNLNEASLAQRDYFNKKSENEHIIAERRKLIIIGTAIFALIFVFSITIIYRMKLRIKNILLQNTASDLIAANERYVFLTAEISELNDTVASKDSKINELTHKLSNNSQSCSYELNQIVYMNFATYWKRITAASRILLETDDTKSKVMASRNLQKEIAQLQSDKSYYTIEKLVNTYHGNIMNNARRELNDLKEKELRLLCLIISGIEPELISIFYGVSRNSFGPLRIRLRKRIENCRSVNREIYLDMI